MKSNFLSAIVGTVALLAFLGTAQAQSFQIDEARFGGAWIDMPFGEEESYYNYNFPGINGEILFTPFDFDMSEDGTEGILRTILTPRLHVGTTISFDDASPSSIYTGLTWHHQLTEQFFVEASFGGRCTTARKVSNRFQRPSINGASGQTCCSVNLCRLVST